MKHRSTGRSAKDESGRRVMRVEQEVQKTIAQFLISGFRLPLPGLVTISRVSMAGDLRTAKVYVSVLGADDERNQALETLQSRAFEVQNFIGKELRMRYCPKLSFYLDDTTEHVLKIDRILHELDQQKKEQSKPEGNEDTAGDSESGDQG
ncbi:MAG: ribosome-binding factor A [Bdellovibrio sp. CG10_big_fil_rev_8_21_14_0_10_47_8]|nr:MAG: ribosome-binding factor A [Bdellovibrio sp. CG10_big_fil_rev_8_21_14_0_10_47_8]